MMKGRRSWCRNKTPNELKPTISEALFQGLRVLSDQLLSSSHHWRPCRQKNRGLLDKGKCGLRKKKNCIEACDFIFGLSGSCKVRLSLACCSWGHGKNSSEIRHGDRLWVIVWKCLASDKAEPVLISLHVKVKRSLSWFLFALRRHCSR